MPHGRTDVRWGATTSKARDERRGRPRHGPLHLPLVLLALTSLASCAGAATPRPGPAAQLPQAAELPQASFAVISDIHVFDPALGTSGNAFKRAVQSDRKLIRESPEILDEALRLAQGGAPSFLLVCGDLSKDGERQSHLLVASKLAALTRAGVRVFVVPGNHDVLNPAASGYGPDGAFPVSDVTPAEFAEIYRECGYGDALYRDPGSLSYVAEPVAGLWLLAIDSVSYDHNPGRSRPVTGGGVTPTRMRWIESMLAEAQGQGKAVIVMMHHGVVEHFDGNARWFPQYLVNNWREMGELLASSHVGIVFTGHFHAQDVAVRRWPDGRFLYDVETGSTVTWPDPVRTVEIDPSGSVRIHSSFITELPSFAARGVDFESYAEQFTRDRARAVTLSALVRYGMAKQDAEVLAAQAADAMLATGRGDERSPSGRTLGAPRMGLLGRLFVTAARRLADGLWNDPAPPDNDLTIDLPRGN